MTCVAPGAVERESAAAADPRSAAAPPTWRTLRPAPHHVDLRQAGTDEPGTTRFVRGGDGRRSVTVP